MANCDACNLDMMKAPGCTLATYEDFIDGMTYARIPYVGVRHHQTNELLRCHDCNVEPDKLHHPGCDAERCPRCEGQAIGCGC